MLLYEDLLTQISRSGPCYRWVITLLVAFLSMKSAFDMFILNLATAKVPFHCAEVELDGATLQWEAIAKNVSLNMSQFTCMRPQLQTAANGSLQLVDAKNATQSKCSSWKFFPQPAHRTTMFTEYEMVCDRSYLTDRMQTIMQLGIFLSTLFGPSGDIIGRKPLLVAFCYLDLTCNIMLIFAKDLTMQMVLRFFMGFGAPAVLVGVILVTEIVAEDYRGVHGNLLWVLWVIGYSCSALISFCIPQWRLQMVAVVCIIGAGYLTYIPALPESPRWLLTRGKTRRARRIIKEMCRFSNCKDAVDNFNFEDNELTKGSDSSDKKGILRLIPQDNICTLQFFITLSVVTLNFFTVSLVYFALSFKRDFITRDPYLNVLISGLLELPAYFVAWQLTVRAGRKLSSLGTMCSCGVGLILLPYIPQNPNIVFQPYSVGAIIVKFCVTVAFSVLAMYGSEVLPTRVRSCAYFFACCLMRSGQFLAPELGGFLAEIYEPLPNLLYGALAVLAGLSCLLLPETKGRPMPDSVQEMESGASCICGSAERHGGADIEIEVDAQSEQEMKPLSA